MVSLIGPWLEPCFHLWTKPCGQESDLPRDSWLEGQLHAKKACGRQWEWVFPPKLYQATGERGNKTTDVPDSSLENASRPTFLK